VSIFRAVTIVAGIYGQNNPVKNFTCVCLESSSEKYEDKAKTVKTVSGTEFLLLGASQTRTCLEVLKACPKALKGMIPANKSVTAPAWVFAWSVPLALSMPCFVL
jgi:hypothetical protein